MLSVRDEEQGYFGPNSALPVTEKRGTSLLRTSYIAYLIREPVTKRNSSFGLSGTGCECDVRGAVTKEQVEKVEKTVAELFRIFSKRAEIDIEAPSLLWMEHSHFLKTSLFTLSKSFQCLDSSRPWLCYWILHGLELLDQTLTLDDISRIAQFIGRCQSPKGGFGGGPSQFPHLATTYAAVNALCILGTEEAYNIIDREKLKQFLWSVRSPTGAFHMHEGGEIDLRGVYCAVSVARLTNIYSNTLFENSAHWIARHSVRQPSAYQSSLDDVNPPPPYHTNVPTATELQYSCQTYEGGFSSVPGTEAHGGYAFCGLAALRLLNKEHLCDMNALLRWLVNRQMRFEGGFQGRTNKLVDGCYSFWQGGAFPLLHRILNEENVNMVSGERWLFHQEALQEYILICCQHSSGGLIDKPNKPRDIYHTCYTLSGLSVAQHSPGGKLCVVGGDRNELVG
uniref:Protein farnesyltransferase subunit beta n=1 Tax=Timema douglasi TaxID=61478 RepID=A0A7R8VLI2_TIMDO|nr:unnamed protein product [Timema douglasi]